MQTIRSYTPFFSAALLMWVVLLAIYPYYRFYVDPDATAYLTISQRYASGDYAKAINGYWSPWSCWLTAFFIKAGSQSFPAAIVVNTLGATGLLYISQSLFLYFSIRRLAQWLLTISLAFFLCYAVFWQNFADLWECFFLLASLRIMLNDTYSIRPAFWILNGMVGALAYFSKAYAFPFFILNTLCCTYLLAKVYGYKNGLKPALVSIAVMVVCSSWWVYLLYDKYGIITTSTAGTLNTSWYLVGHPYWADGIKHLVPPVYMDSPYYWEDPYLVNGDTPHFWSSIKLFVLQIVKAAFNLLKMVKSMSEISAFMFLVWFLAWGILFSQSLRQYFSGKARVLVLSFLLFPIGFVLINFEPRYIWYMLPLSMVIGVLLMEQMQLSARFRNILLAVFAASYLFVPVAGLKAMYREGYAEQEATRQLTNLGIKGSFTANVVYGPQMASVARLAYFSGNTYYNMPYANIPKQELLQEMRRYRIKYYFHFQLPIDGDDFILADEQGQPFPEVSLGRVDGFKVFLINP